MKKRFSGLTVGIIAFLMLATGVAASNYYHWAGSQDFDDSMNNMDKIEYGISLLMGDLEKEEQANQSKQEELDELKKKIREATDKEEGTITDLINEKNTLKSDLETMTADRDKLQGNLNLIATETSKYVVELNNINGAGPKYQYLVDNVDPNLKYLYAMGNLSAYTPLDKDPGNGPKDKQLQQAIEDMKKVKGKSEDTLGAFDEETQKRIEDDLKDESNEEINTTDYTPGDKGKQDLEESN